MSLIAADDAGAGSGPNNCGDTAAARTLDPGHSATNRTNYMFLISPTVSRGGSCRGVVQPAEQYLVIMRGGLDFFVQHVLI